VTLLRPSEVLEPQPTPIDPVRGDLLERRIRYGRSKVERSAGRTARPAGIPDEAGKLERRGGGFECGARERHNPATAPL
jgi:hypothetical protein